MFCKHVENVYFTDMKTLYLVRHSKSSWSIDGIPDRDRPLKGRGIRDAHLVSEVINHSLRGNSSVKLYSSPATRALHTALIFAKNFNIKASQVAIKESLYDCNMHGFLSCVKSGSDTSDIAFYFAHNPTITEFVNIMTNAQISNIPTTGLVSIRFDVDHWAEIEPDAELIQFEYPKRLK
jgi:phosphohistidine phosphatase